MPARGNTDCQRCIPLDRDDSRRASFEDRPDIVGATQKDCTGMAADRGWRCVLAPLCFSLRSVGANTQLRARKLAGYDIAPMRRRKRLALPTRTKKVVEL